MATDVLATQGTSISAAMVSMINNNDIDWVGQKQERFQQINSALDGLLIPYSKSALGWTDLMTFSKSSLPLFVTYSSTITLILFR